jgi:hypothetical protein
MISGFLVLLGLLLGLILGKLIYQDRYRKKYRQEHMNSLNCHFLPADKTEFYAVTIATNISPQSERLLKSLHRNSIDTSILAVGCKWQGFGNKIFWLREYFSALDLLIDSDPIILFVDAYDVINLAPRAELLEKFRSFDSPIVVGAEKSCWPNPADAPLFPHQEKPFRFLNAGCIIGYKSAISKCIAKFAISPMDSEQGAWTKAFLSGEDNIKIDYDGKLFFNLHGADLSDYEVTGLERGRWTLTHSRETPCIIHGNGPSGIVLNRMYPVDGRSLD